MTGTARGPAYGGEGRTGREGGSFSENSLTISSNSASLSGLKRHTGEGPPGSGYCCPVVAGLGVPRCGGGVSPERPGVKVGARGVKANG